MNDMESKIKTILEAIEAEAPLTEKQERILSAAIDIFAKKGYSTASTHEIAKKAGVAEGTIFHYYKTKKDLLYAVVLPVLSKVIAPFAVKGFVEDVFQEEQASFETFIRVLIQNRFAYIKNHRAIVKIFLQEIAFHEELQQVYKNVFHQHIYGKMKAVIESFQSKGQVVSMPPEAVIRHIISSIVGFLLVRFILLPDNDWDDEAEIGYTARCILHGLSVLSS